MVRTVEKRKLQIGDLMLENLLQLDFFVSPYFFSRYSFRSSLAISILDFLVSHSAPQISAIPDLHFYSCSELRISCKRAESFESSFAESIFYAFLLSYSGWIRIHFQFQHVTFWIAPRAILQAIFLYFQTSLIFRIGNLNLIEWIFKIYGIW